VNGSTAYALRLYVAGGTALDGAALRTVEALRERGTNIDVEIVDVLASPGRAEADRILATPTLIRLEPPPVRKLVGDLRDAQKVGELLDLSRPEVPL
jgi:circadian clock protein KaiB